MESLLLALVTTIALPAIAVVVLYFVIRLAVRHALTDVGFEGPAPLGRPATAQPTDRTEPTP